MRHLTRAGATAALPRRLVLGGLTAVAAAAVSSPFLASRSSSAAPTVPPTSRAARTIRPSFLLVVVDDLGWGEVGAYGQRVIQTPVLDALSDEGLRFTQAYATPTCAPTRASLLTGLHSGHARVRSNADAVTGLRAEDVTIAEVLREAGYRTGLVGKWGLGPENGSNPSHPNHQGFDFFFGYINQRLAHDYWPTHLWRDGQRSPIPANADGDVVYAPDLFTAEALGFLDGLASDQSFFLTVSLTTPHAPNEIPSDAPYSTRPWPQGERNHAAQVTATDAEIGKLVQALADRGLAEETVVLVVSDNGPHEEGAGYAHVGSTLPHDADFFDSNGPLRGTKRDVYEGGIRVPLIARVPPGLGGAAGGVVDRPVAVWDIPSTFAELAGVEMPTALDGVSFAAELTGGTSPGHDHLYWQFLENGLDEAVRFGGWKAVRHDGGPVELYQLTRDPGEQTDQARRFPSVARKAELLIAAAAG